MVRVGSTLQLAEDRDNTIHRCQTVSISPSPRPARAAGQLIVIGHLRERVQTPGRRQTHLALRVSVSWSTGVPRDQLMFVTKDERPQRETVTEDVKSSVWSLLGGGG